MSALACAKCHKFMRTKKLGVCVEEGMPQGDTWKSYKLWMADLCECPECGAEMVTGFGQAPIAEHYKPEYPGLLERLRPLFRIDDGGGRQP